MVGKRRALPQWTGASQVDIDWRAGVCDDVYTPVKLKDPFQPPAAAGQETQSEDAEAGGDSKRQRKTWQDKPRSFQSIFTEYQGRVEACWEESAAIQACKAQADALYTAMLETPIQDARLSVAGEQNRIMSRAHAMLDVLVKQDRTVAEMCGPSRSQQGGGVGVNAHAPSTTPSPPQQPAYSAPAQVSPAQAAAPPPPPVVTAAEASAYSSAHTVNRLYPFNTAAAPHPSRHNRPPSVPEDAPLPSASSPDAPGSPDQQQEGQQPPHQHHKVHIERSSNEEVPDATPEECLLSVCMMLAALYEQTPFSETELRRRVFDDFTQLKRHFRSDDLTVMHGRTGSIKELFDSIKELDKSKGLQNLLGILFEDWKVNDRVSQFIMADQITVQVISLTPQGPIGKFACTMRTFSTLSLLHQVLLKEMFYGMFAHKNPPRGQHETMTAKDPLDYVDFVEAMSRNMPYRKLARPGGGLVFYAWMYAPEANATAETWAEVFEQKQGAVPALYDGVRMPEGLVRHLNEDGDYSLDLDLATQHDMREECSSQTPLAFPWADDLLGKFMRNLRAQRQKQDGSKQPSHPLKQEHNKQEQKQETKQQQSSSRVQKQKPSKQEPKQTQTQQQHTQQTLHPANNNGCAVKQEESQPSVLTGLELQGSHTNGGAAAHLNGSNGSSSRAGNVVHGSGVNGLNGTAGMNGNGAAGMGVNGMNGMSGNGVNGMNGAAGGNGASLQGEGTRGLCEGVHHTHGKGFNRTEQTEDGRPHPIVNAEDSGRLVLPLGIFLVGIICSGAHTNTQIHVEDLLLMSININMFGAPKVWWWVPKESAQDFKNYAESITEGGRKELYTKSISPFLQDREENPPQPTLPLESLRAMGVKRTIQMPGMGILTMPGYAFHFTVSQGLNLAESCNMFLEVMGWTFEKLWKVRPLEQYPNEVDDMARYMRDTGVLSKLGVPDVLPEHPQRVHRSLKQHNLGHGKVVNSDGSKLQRYVTPDLVKYVSLPSKEKQEEECKRIIKQRQQQQQPIIVIV